MTLQILHKHKEAIDKRIAELESDVKAEGPQGKINETSLERFYSYLADKAFENLHITLTPYNEIYINYDMNEKHWSLRFLSDGIIKVICRYEISK